jgi:hypothetical protein
MLHPTRSTGKPVRVPRTKAFDNTPGNLRAVDSFEEIKRLGEAAAQRLRSLG